jgi:hypothetical protein
LLSAAILKFLIKLLFLSLQLGKVKILQALIFKVHLKVIIVKFMMAVLVIVKQLE